MKKQALLGNAVLLSTALVSVFTTTAPANAIIFNFTPADNGLSSIVKTVDGITLTLSNPSPATTFRADNDGLAILSQGSFTNISSFQMSFSSAVELTSYTVGYVNSSVNGNESITFFDGTSTSTETSPFVLGTRNFNNQFTVGANQTIDVSTSGVECCDLIQLSSIEVTSATPVPLETDALPIVISGLFTGGGVWFKRKRSQAKVAKFLETTNTNELA